MLTKVEAYTSSPEAPALTLSDPGRPETDFIQVRNIDGLDPVQASVNMSSLAAVDGMAYIDSKVPSRNIVLTLHPNPDYTTWKFETLRQLIYSYFMPKNSVKLVFHSDEVGVVQIQGIVESVTANPFSKDPEYLVSIVCPDPYFTSIDPVEISSNTIRPEDPPGSVINNGNVETPIYIRLDYSSGTSPAYVRIQLGNPMLSFFQTYGLITATSYFDLQSKPRFKFVRDVNLDTAVITNRLSEIQDGSKWPFLLPGLNQIGIITDTGVQTWDLKYYERYGGI
jgi:hypothetical protein